jgi:predicted nucleotidyltransferase
MKNNKLEIVIGLIESEERPTIRKLSGETGIKYSNVYNIVKKLQNEEIISLKKTGNAYSCSINKKVDPLIFEAEFHRRKKLLKNGDFQILHRRLSSLLFSFVAIIFGSNAKGTATWNSDIDLMIISEKNREKEIGRIISLLPLKIHFVFFTYEEFLSMERSKDFSVVSEAIKRNIILVGIEDYYRLMENVGQ